MTNRTEALSFFKLSDLDPSDISDKIITSITRNQDVLDISYNNGEVKSVPVGAEARDGVTISTAQITPEGELIVVLSDESEFNLGQIEADAEFTNYEGLGVYVATENGNLIFKPVSVDGNISITGRVISVNDVQVTANSPLYSNNLSTIGEILNESLTTNIDGYIKRHLSGLHDIANGMTLSSGSLLMASGRYFINGFFPVNTTGESYISVMLAGVEVLTSASVTNTNGTVDCVLSGVIDVTEDLTELSIMQYSSVEESVYDTSTGSLKMWRLSDIGATLSGNTAFDIFNTINGVYQSNINDPDPTGYVDDFGLNLSDSAKWWTGVLAPNGKIYGAPSSSTDILIIDTNNDTAVRDSMGLDLTGTNKFRGGCLGDDGLIYMIPYSGTVGGVLIIDPSDDSAWFEDFGISWGGHSSGVNGNNGKIYCPPQGDSQFNVIDTASGTAIKTDFGVSWTGRFESGVCHPDGFVVFPPGTGNDDCIIIDTSDDSAVLSTGINVPSQTSKYFNAVLGGDGKVYLCPQGTNVIGVVDVNTKEYYGDDYGVDFDDGLGSIGRSNKWKGGVVSHYGTIYLLPDRRGAIGILDTNTQSFSLFDISSLFSVSTSITLILGGVTAPNGKIYTVPGSASYSFVYVNSVTETLSLQACISPYLNKG